MASAPSSVRAPGAKRPCPPIRVAVVGVSAGRTCGARDHAVLLSEALRSEDVSCSLHWLGRESESLRAAQAEVRAWARALVEELDRTRPDAILLHYSVFAYAYRGLPVFVAPVMRALRSSRIPVTTVLHEFVYPWRHGGWRGKVWAITQRALLIEVMRSSAAVVLTTDFRVEWLATRPWLPRRRAVVAPVFSNLPPATAESHVSATAGPPVGATAESPVGATAGSRVSATAVSATAGSPVCPPGPVIGLFGYSFQGAAASLVLGAVALSRDRGLPVRLMLLGAPGRPSAAADMWLQGARARNVEHALSFSGTLPLQELANALAACEMLLFADASGPSSRKGTLAASLASGRPVIAIDGPRRWAELMEARAAHVVQPTSPALADAILALLRDEPLREALGARGRAFAAQKMGVTRAAHAVSGLLAEVVGTRVG